MICPWCNKDQPEEIFQNHHKNHIHTDDTPENTIKICYGCHQRHHRESGYTTVILEKNEYKPKTLEDGFKEIDDRMMLEIYEKHYAGGIVIDKLIERFGRAQHPGNMFEKLNPLVFRECSVGQPLPPLPSDNGRKGTGILSRLIINDSTDEVPPQQTPKAENST